MEDVKQKHNYEIMYIVDDQNQEKAQVIKKELSAILEKDNGKINKVEDSIRTFAYPINKKVKGHYFVMQVSTTPANIAAFNRIALIKQKQLEVYRFLVVNLDSEKINKFKPKRVVENNYQARPPRVAGRSNYRRPDNQNPERKPRPIAGAENTYRGRSTNNSNINHNRTSNVSPTPTTDKKS